MQQHISKAGMKLSVVLLLTCLRAAVSQPPTISVWYFKPEPADSCPVGVPDKNCLVFSQILLNTTALEEIFTSNVIIKFLGGDHIIQLPGGGYLTYKGVENVTIIGSSNQVLNHIGIAVPASRITCRSPFSLIFSNISGLTIQNMTISGCGAPVAEDIINEAFIVQSKGIHTFGLGQSIAVLLINIRNFTMIRSVVQSSLGYGILGVNVLGNSEIFGSFFLLNNNYTVGRKQCTEPPVVTPDDVFACNGGNALFVYEDLLECPSVPLQYNLAIRSCLFGLGVNGYGGTLNDEFLTRGGTGIGVTMSQSSYGVTVELDNVTVFGNAGLIGANLYIALYDVVDNSTVIIRNSRSLEANGGLLNPSQFFADSASASAGLHVQYGLPYAIPEIQQTVCPSKKFYQEDIVTIVNTIFSGNVAFLGAGAYIDVRIGVGGAPDHGVSPVRFILDRCTFIGNTGITGTGLYFSQQNGLGAGNSELILNGVTFINNSYIVPVKSITELFTTYQLNTVQFISSKNVTMTNCNIMGSEGSALSAFGSNIVMSGNLVFDKNTGLNGGGLDLQDSRVAFKPDSRITFTDNYAVNYGGAIHVAGRSDVILPCFFQIHNPNFLRDPNVTLYFENNYAQNAGSVLYGGSIDRCIVTANSGFQANQSGNVFDYLASIGPHSNETSKISSDPLNVCFCFNGKPNCSVRSMTLTRFPGETIEVSVVTVGQRLGTTPSFVYTVPSRSAAKIRADQETQVVEKTCTRVNFTVSSIQQPAVSLNLQTNAFAINSKVRMDIELLACPLGFVHSNVTGVCECDPISQSDSFNVSCNIDMQTIVRVERSWLNASFLGPNGTYNGILVLGNCPYDYCLQQASNVNLLEPDTQCNFNRTGVLCGACKDGLSLTLATSRCIACSNTGIVLFVLYLVAAFGLVAILFSLDLTISCGTLSGIIFYANIISIHQSIFFPSGEYNIITVFLAWLNLESGIPLCLYNGFDAYARVWLGFVFPIYIWIIVVVIILVSRWSSRIARLAGQKPVSVLATLILLSYSKLLSVSIASLSFASVLEPNQQYDPVWSVDGNIGFFAGRHIPLGIFATAVMLFFVIPYTLLLVIVPLPWVQARSTSRLLTWINTLKPFLDAHQGPFKRHFRNWIGILLLARAFLATLASFSVGEYNSDNIILVVITLMAVVLISVAWINGGVYLKHTHNLLECSFYMNLGILSVFSLYARGSDNTESHQHNIILTSGWIALLEFVGIIGYHLLKRLDSIRQFQNMKKSVTDGISTKMGKGKLMRKGKVSINELSISTAPPNTEKTTTVISLREPLLDEVV